MKIIRIGLAAVLALVVMAPASAAFAAKKPTAPADGIDPKYREKGMTDTPALVTAAGLACTVSDARWIGEDKKSGQSYYEVACNPGLGGVLVAKKDDPKPAYYPCIETGKPGPDGKPGSLACKLAANADPIQALAPFVAKSGVTCAVDKARSIGASTRNTFFEVSCQGGYGFILVASYPADANAEVKANTCLAYEAGGNLFCELTSRESQLAMVDTLAAASGKNCVVKDKRYILASTTGSLYFEVACADGKGYVLERASNGSLARAIDCANAPGGAECTLTDARQAQTEQAGLYSRLAGKAGFPCNVEKYALFPTRVARQEVVELKCSDRPDGAVAVFDAEGPGRVYNCILAEVQGYRCTFSPKEAAMPKLSADLKGLGKGSCVVSDARVIGKSDAGDGYVEVACADGLPGWVMVYPTSTNSPKEVLSCRQASSVGGGCKLATNKTSG
ncbi:MAG: hypothetical protein Q8L23_18110 [Caulobacter sp.]|nr:hypothetical protein [Caulobacter sp.]